MNNSKRINWVVIFGVSLSIAITIALAYHLLLGNKSYFLGGDTSHGHYQIELKCESCHSSSFAGPDQMQQSCESCHAKALDKSNDSHPKSVFTDPRNAELLGKLDARYCVTCHREHKPEITRSGGVTLAEDFCFHCHQTIAEDRPSHKDFKFDTCASSGCHNFHDNSMLYEKFLKRHLTEPENNQVQTVHARTALNKWLKKNKKAKPLNSSQADLGARSFAQQNVSISNIFAINKDWSQSVHALTEVNCSSCHLTEFDGTESNTTKVNYAAKLNPNTDVCESCHRDEFKTLLEGKHGMRLAVELTPMHTGAARGEFVHSEDKTLNCMSCHDPHKSNIKQAATQACLSCHNDQHSKNYRNSAHFDLWQKELSGESEENTGVSCATCHLPRIKKGKNVAVMHNQNHNLRPNSKMLRQVCMNCHGLDFSLAALSDKQLILENFNASPTKMHQTLELIKKRVEESQSH